MPLRDRKMCWQHDPSPDTVERREVALKRRREAARGRRRRRIGAEPWEVVCFSHAKRFIHDWMQEEHCDRDGWPCAATDRGGLTNALARYIGEAAEELENR